MPDEIFGSVSSNLQSLSAFLQAFYPVVPNRGVNGYVGGGLGYHHSSLSGKNFEGKNSDNLAIRLVAGAEYHVATNWWLLTETGYEQVVAREMQIDPSNFRVLFGFNYKYTNY
jgi:opacity protein-like surface antigen